ncbi:hypothetical protein Anas_14185, partial [Armadillidium nasatum]
SEFGIAAMKLSNLACASHFAICIESIENLMLISNDEDHVDVGSIYKNVRQSSLLLDYAYIFNAPRKLKTLLFLLLENWVTSIGIKETEEDTDPRKRNETSSV